jgi:homoserine dehydrogenase
VGGVLVLAALRGEDVSRDASVGLEEKSMIAIGVLGLGNVGTGFMELLNSGKQTIENRLGTSVSVKKILVRDTGRPRARLAAGIITDRPDDILEDPSISIVVELMGGLEPARTYIRRALSRGKSVVTANKEVVSCYGAELMDLARENGVRFLFEGSVGGGIPIIRPIKECLAANEIHSVTGILNGTTNFILTRMEEDSMELNEALAEAQRLGYAEADPANDITGADVARKIAILATMAFRRGIIPDVVSTTGIDRVVRLKSKINCLTGRPARLANRITLLVSWSTIPVEGMETWQWRHSRDAVRISLGRSSVIDCL